MLENNASESHACQFFSETKMGQKNRPRGKIRKTISVLLCFALVLALIPISVLATALHFYPVITYTENGQTKTLSLSNDDSVGLWNYGGDNDADLFLISLPSGAEIQNISIPDMSQYVIEMEIDGVDDVLDATSYYSQKTFPTLQTIKEQVTIISDTGFRTPDSNADEGYSYALADDETGITEEMLNKIPNKSVEGYLLVFYVKDSRDNWIALPGIIIQYPTGNSSVPETPEIKEIKTEIAKVDGEAASKWIQSGDRYNGKTTSQNEAGFWSDLQPILTTAKDIVAGKSSANPSEILTKLKNAIVNLIPIGQINPTNLYETIERCKKSNDDLKGYNDKTVNAYRTALTEANAYLDALFQKDAETGKVEPTTENVAGNQGKADGYATKLTNAYKELASALDRYGSVSLALDAIPALCELADKAIGNTALDGRDTLKTKRDAAYAVWQEYVETQLNLNASEYREIRTAYRELFDAYYLGLTNTADSITVNVRVTDSASLKKPTGFPQGEWASTTWTGSVTLTGDQTLGALETQLTDKGKLYYGGKIDNYGAASYAAIINGVYPHSLQSFNSYFSDDYYENGTRVYYSDRYVLHDGDMVELALLPTPEVSSYAGAGNSLNENYTMRYMQTARFEQDGEPVTGTLTVNEGEPLTLHVSRAYASLQNYTGEYSAFSGAKLYVSPENSGTTAAAAGEAAAPTFDTGYQTDENGNVTVTLYGSGWVHLYAVDPRDGKGFWGNTDVSGGPQIEELPSMTVGASVWIYVNAKSGDELTAGLAALKQELDDSYQDVDRTLFTNDELKQIDDTYAEKREAFQTVTNLTNAKNLVREFDALVAQLEKAHKNSDFPKERSIQGALNCLPDDVRDFTQGFAERFRYLQSMIDSATQHQINQMTTAQKAKYEKLKEAYGEDGTNLPAEVDPTVTVKVMGDTDYQNDFIVANDRSYSYVPSDYAKDDSRVNVPGSDDNRIRTSAALGAFDGTDGYRVQEGSYYQLIIARKLEGGAYECSYNATVVKVEVEDEDGNPIEGVTVRTPNYTDANPDSSRRRFFYEPSSTGYDGKGANGMKAAIITFDCVMPHNIVVKVYLEKVATPDELTAAKTSLKNELTTAYQAYVKSNYSNTNWNTLVKAYNDGIANIGKAEDVTTATAAKTAALEAMAAVDADMAQDYGTVYVTIENTTFTHDLWPTGKTYWEGTPINHFEVNLTAASTMMTCVVDALDQHGWSQTGASSNYISSINGLSAFDGGSQSGWMGTLNDWFTNEGFGNFTVANGKLGDGDEIRIMYTRTGYGEDLGGTWNNQNTTLRALDVTNGTIFPAFTSGTIGSTNEYTLQIDDEKAEIKITPTATNKNFLVKTFLNEQVTNNTEGVSFYKRTQTIPVVAGDTIYVGCGVKGWPTMNTQAGNTQTANGTWYVLKVVNAQVDDGSAYVMGLIDKYCVKVESYNYKSMENGLSITRAAYEALSDTSKQNVTNYQKLLDAEAGVASFKKTADLSVKIAALPSVYRATLEDVEQIKSVQEIYESLTQEEKDRLTVNEYNKLMALIEKIDGLNQAAADKVIADSTAIGPIDEITLESAKQIQKARAGYDALNKYAQYIVEYAKPVNYYTLLDAEVKLKELQDAAAEQERIDRAAAAAVDNLIDAIGEVTLKSKQAIETARAAYDNLTPTQKTYVTKLDTLTAAETAYKALVDRKAADDVIEKINAIGKVTLESKTAIEAARAAYNALTNDQKLLVENYDVLTAAEAELARLEAEAKDKADREAAAQVDEMIERLFPVTRYSGPAIRMARAAYEALTEDQKALVTRYSDLVRAEKEYSAIPPLTPSTPAKPSQKPDTSKDNLSFTDVTSGSWYYDGVKYVCDNGLMNGTSANEFNPNANTTRSMIVTILARMEGVNTSGGETWYARGREWSMGAGISDGTNMTGKITREQLAAMLYRYAKMKGYDVSASASLSGYTDASSVSGWATDAMRWAVSAGLINGRTATTLAPQGNATRAEVASILMRFMQKYTK